MSEKLPVALITSNRGKMEQFAKQASGLSQTRFSNPLFDEERIKQEIEGRGITSGFEYVAAISLSKFKSQREAVLTQEGRATDYAMLVSDSCVMVERKGEMYALNRDGLSDTDSAEAIEEINRKHEITFVGAVTFGRKQGNSAFTVLTYTKIPQEKNIDHFPLTLFEVADNLDKKKGAEAGYIYYSPDITSGKYKAEFKPKLEHAQFEDEEGGGVRPFISGLTSDVIGLADDAMQQDKKTAPFLENLVSSRPFNTLFFYSEFKRSGLSMTDFYKQIVERRTEYFEKFGGNCSFHTLALADELTAKGEEPQILLYPTKIPVHERGHSGIIVNQGQIQYYYDPGLTIPYAIPISDIPLYPFRVGDKNSLILTAVRDQDGDRKPDLFYLNNGTIQVPFCCLETCDRDTFIGQLPGILAELHDIRRDAKLDYHKSEGSKLMGLTLELQTGKLKIDFGRSNFYQGPHTGLFTDERRTEFIRKCEECDINGEAILEEIMSALV